MCKHVFPKLNRTVFLALECDNSKIFGTLVRLNRGLTYKSALSRIDDSGLTDSDFVTFDHALNANAYFLLLLKSVYFRHICSSFILICLCFCEVRTFCKKKMDCFSEHISHVKISIYFTPFSFTEHAWKSVVCENVNNMQIGLSEIEGFAYIYIYMYLSAVPEFHCYDKFQSVKKVSWVSVLKSILRMSWYFSEVRWDAFKSILRY